MSEDPNLPDLSMDPAELFREETFTDGKIGSIRRMIPIKTDGSDDPARDPSYVGSTQLLTPMGTLPLSFEIPAKDLQEAVERFGDEAKKAMQQTVEEMQEMRREAASSIVTPESGGMGGGPGGNPFGGGSGGGIQMP